LFFVSEFLCVLALKPVLIDEHQHKDRPMYLMRFAMLRSWYLLCIAT